MKQAPTRFHAFFFHHYLALTIIVHIVLASSNAFAVDEPAPQRIAIAGGSITEIIYAFKEQDKIVGVDSTSIFPGDALKNKAQLGYVRRVSTEGILSLEPDLMIGEHDTGPSKSLNQLRQTQLNIEILPEETSLLSIEDKIKRIAKLLNVDAKGTALNQLIDYDRDALSFAVDRVSSEPNVLFLLSLRGGTPTAAGQSTSADVVIKAAGGKNALSSKNGWIKLNVESALALNPDAIIVMGNGNSVSRIEQAKQMPHFKYSKAVKNNAVYEIDGGYLLSFGPRAYQAVVELGTMIHPKFPLPENYAFRFPKRANNKQNQSSVH